QDFQGDGGPAIQARFRSSVGAPFEVAVDTIGNLYIADSSDNRIRKVTLDGVINTVAGNGVLGSGGDGGPATGAQLTSPAGIAGDRNGNLYIGERSRVRKVTPDGLISTIANEGASGIAADERGDLYLAADPRILKISFPSTQKSFAIPRLGGVSFSTAG